MSSKFINPLDSVSTKPLVAESSNKEQMESTSMDNNTYGQCPKCQGPMAPVKIANNEDVIWCNGCRVSSPVKE